MNRIILIGFVFAVICLDGWVASAAEPQVIDWMDLLPVKTAEDPFEKLSQKQLDDLAVVARIRRLIAVGKIEPEGPSAREAARIQEQLTRAGIDTTWLLSQRTQVGRLRQIQATSVQPRVEGKLIQLAGFIIPSKKSGDRITEFVLVPDVDSCRDSALPPPNQTVIVRFEEGLVSEGPITAARVTGKIQAKQTTRTLLRSKGPTRITAAYSIAPQSIEVWRAKELDGSRNTLRYDVSRIDSKGTE